MTRGLILSEVTLRFGDLAIVDRETFHLATGRTLIVTGENGAGKTTLLYLCAGLIGVTRGKVMLDGHQPKIDDPSALVRAGVRRGVVFQSGGLLSNTSVLGNVALALRYHADVLRLSEGEIEERATTALREVGIAADDFGALPAHLSYGVRKRVAIARATALEPNFVFCDDPDAGLDVVNAKIVHERLRRFRDDPRVTMIIVSNHRQLLNRLDVEPYELVRGKLLKGASGSVA